MPSASSGQQHQPRNSPIAQANCDATPLALHQPLHSLARLLSARLLSHLLVYMQVELQDAFSKRFVADVALR